MSTNALVAYLREDNSVVSSYVHWDGYTTSVGEMLLEHYNLRVLARDLAEKLGYASSLRETIVASHEDRANSDEAETYESYEDFEEYIREGWETVRRMRKLAEEGATSDYAMYADELEETVTKWNRIGIAKVAEEAMAA